MSRGLPVYVWAALPLLVALLWLASSRLPSLLPGHEQKQPPDEGGIAQRSGPKAAPTISCRHPLIPDRPGSFRRYRSRVSPEPNQSGDVEFRLEESTRDAGAVRLTWRVSVAAEGATDPPRTTHETRRCWPGESAEDYWSGFTLGLKTTATRGELWRWPTALVPGLQIEGSRIQDFAFRDANGAPVSLALTRKHKLVGRETITVPAGTFETWKVEFDEGSTYENRTRRSSGALWLAASVGLVRSVMSSEEQQQRFELLAYGG